MNFLPDFSSFTLALLALIALAAGVSRGFSGFGAALIFVPMASALVGPKLAAPILVIIDPIFASFLVPKSLDKANKTEVGLMLIGALIGVPLGTLILTHYSPLTLRWVIAGAATAMFFLLLSGWRYHGKPHAIATAAVGAISGLFTGIAQIGGPPVVSYWMGTDDDHVKLRANIILYFAASSVLTIVVYLWSGLMSFEILKLAAVAGPLYGLGIWGGSRMFVLASPQFFRMSSLALIAFAILVSLPIFR